MRMSEFVEVPEGKVGGCFVKKTIENVKFNPTTKEKEGHACIQIHPYQEKRNPSLFERAFLKAGLDVFKVKNEIRQRELACV